MNDLSGYEFVATGGRHRSIPGLWQRLEADPARCRRKNFSRLSTNMRSSPNLTLPGRRGTQKVRRGCDNREIWPTGLTGTVLAGRRPIASPASNSTFSRGCHLRLPGNCVLVVRCAVQYPEQRLPPAWPLHVPRPTRVSLPDPDAYLS
jgi:hypothetical protein